MGPRKVFLCVVTRHRGKIWSIQPWPRWKPVWLSRVNLMWVLDTRRRIMTGNSYDAIYGVGGIIVFANRGIPDLRESWRICSNAQIDSRSFDTSDVNTSPSCLKVDRNSSSVTAALCLFYETYILDCLHFWWRFGIYLHCFTCGSILGMGQLNCRLNCYVQECGDGVDGELMTHWIP